MSLWTNLNTAWYNSLYQEFNKMVISAPIRVLYIIQLIFDITIFVFGGYIIISKSTSGRCYSIYEFYATSLIVLALSICYTIMKMRIINNNSSLTSHEITSAMVYRIDGFCYKIFMCLNAIYYFWGIILLIQICSDECRHNYIEKFYSFWAMYIIFSVRMIILMFWAVVDNCYTYYFRRSGYEPQV